VKLSLELKPWWVIQKECSRQMRMAVHEAVRNNNIRERVGLIRPMKEHKEGTYISGK